MVQGWGGTDGGAKACCFCLILTQVLQGFRAGIGQMVELIPAIFCWWEVTELL